jgi:hypothetical protein
MILSGVKPILQAGFYTRSGRDSSRGEMKEDSQCLKSVAYRSKR